MANKILEIKDKNINISFQHTNINIPVRMKYGMNKALNNRIFNDYRVRATEEHYAIAETIQAINRARLLEDDRVVDVYLCSSESLGGDIEITGFFRAGDFFTNEKYLDNNMKYKNAVKKLKKLGYCPITPTGKIGKEHYKYLGFKQHYIDKHMDEINKVFINSGIQRKTFEIKIGRNPYKEKHFYVWDDKKLQELFKKNSWNIK